jgi:hypothetical protein
MASTVSEHSQTVNWGKFYISEPACLSSSITDVLVVREREKIQTKLVNLV